MGTVEQANELAVLSVGRNPLWTTKGVVANGDGSAEYAPLPATASSGAFLDNSPNVLVAVDLRNQIHRRQVLIDITAVDVTDTYVVTIDGNSASYPANPGDTVEDIATGIAAAMLLVGAITALGTPLAIEDLGDGLAGDGAVNCVRFRGLAETDFYVTLSTGAAGTMRARADALTAEVDIYTTAGGTLDTGPGGLMPNLDTGGGSTVWRHINALTINVDSEGFIERYTLAGSGRTYVKLSNVTGHGSDAAAGANTLVPQCRVRYGRATAE